MIVDNFSGRHARVDLYLAGFIIFPSSMISLGKCRVTVTGNTAREIRYIDINISNNIEYYLISIFSKLE